MHRRASASLSIAALVVLSVSGCAKGSSPSAPPASAPAAAGKPALAAKPAQDPLTSAVLFKRLLDETDLGQGYTRKKESGQGDRDDVTVIGCPALEKLGGGAAGGDLDFPNSAKATFSYNRGTGSEVAEELYSDSVDKLGPNTRTVFEAMTGCPLYQVVVGDAPIAVTTQKLPAPALGDEAWSQLLTFTAGGRDTVMKQTAVRDGSILVVVSGSPALVDTHLARAVGKAHG
ncbi:hypothetical protein [Streptomyces roseolus]|uniref:hypothetical protein n=1 Tax=Streptomyces roseolus TaxID=67358 RepID=UPI0036682E56